MGLVVVRIKDSTDFSVNQQTKLRQQNNLLKQHIEVGLSTYLSFNEPSRRATVRTIEVVMAQIPNSGSNLLCLALARITGLNTIP